MLAHIDSLQLPIYKLDVYHSLKKLYADSNHADSADYYYDKFLRMLDGLERSIGYGNALPKSAQKRGEKYSSEYASCHRR